MNYKKIFPVVALAALFATACDDNKMEWEEMDPSKEISQSEIPLAMAEKISRYEVLKNYTDMVIGVGVDLATYMDDKNEKYIKIVNENFDEVVIGYDMKHGAMVNSKGEINFTRVDAFIEKAKANDLKIYGHTLVWHQNQNASYLNGLIAPEVIPAPAGTNLLDLSGLEDGSFDGWIKQNPGDGITIAEGGGLGAGTNAVKLVSGPSSSAAYNLQIISPDIPVIEGHTYEISFYIKSDQPGKGRISFGGLENNYPWKDWLNTGSGTEAFETTSTWQQVKFTVDDFNATVFHMAFDLGYLPGVTYYLDVANIIVVDLDGIVEPMNYLANGKFDEGIEGWKKINGPENSVSLASPTEAYQGGGALKVEHNISEPTNQWKMQVQSVFTEILPAGDYVVSYYIKSEAAGSVRCSTTGTERYQGDQTTSSTWKLVEWNIVSDGNITGLSFDLGAVAGTYYIDNVLVTPKNASPAPGLKSLKAGPTYIEKTDEEKTQIIGEAMENWIVSMMEHYKDEVHAWDVVNEPMKENGSRRDGNVNDPANDEFYWVKYLGDDYAVTAFKLAREYGNADDVLFINDYNLEHSLAKCDGLIEYVQYIESKGAQVDGIGTQMHISIDTNKENIIQMFEKLAASGKKIKVTELDIKVNTDAPSADHYQQQAEMYQFVVDSYKELIPVDQQYGITVWGVSDNAKEHEYWIPDDAPNLWDAKYERKLSYKTFADGLAGKDVSEDFTGELVN